MGSSSLSGKVFFDFSCVDFWDVERYYSEGKRKWHSAFYVIQTLVSWNGHDAELGKGVMIWWSLLSW